MVSCRGYRYTPDLVLLGFTTANDVRESYAPLNRRAPRANIGKPFFLVRNGQLVKFPSPGTRGAAGMVGSLRRSRANTASHPGWFGPAWTQTVRWPREVVETPPQPDPLSKLRADMYVYCLDVPALKAAWEVSTWLLDELHKLTRQHGAPLAMVVVNGPWTHDRKRFEFWFRQTPKAVSLCDPLRPNPRIERIAPERGIRTLDLYEPFETAKSQGKLFFDSDPHWTPLGHQVAAKAVADFLIRQGLLRKPGVPRGAAPTRGLYCTGPFPEGNTLRGRKPWLKQPMQLVGASRGRAASRGSSPSSSDVA